MVKGLLIDRHILSSVRVDVKSFHVVSIDKAINFVTGVVAAVVLKALPIEVLPESSL